MNSPEARALGLAGLVELRPPRHADERGFFAEVWREEWAGTLGVDRGFVQDNHSHSNKRGVLRGLHLQLAPLAQDKLVRVPRGAIFDVAVDVRRGSPTFGRWEGLIVSAERWNQLFVPAGFAHGFLVLEDDTDVIYKVTARYDRDAERTIRFDDPAIGIDWPIEPQDITLSPKDRAAQRLVDLEGLT